MFESATHKKTNEKKSEWLDCVESKQNNIINEEKKIKHIQHSHTFIYIYTNTNISALKYQTKGDINRI